jgi:Spy/CpxP family protein refolding chaperone
MKNLIFTIVLLNSLSFFSQESKSDKVEAMKVGFITNRLELTAKEAQVFWPLYNEYNSKMEKLRKTKRSDFEELKNKSDNITDKELETFINEVFASKQKELDLQKEYYEKYAKVLTVKKVAMLYQAENQFKRELLRKIKEKK